MKIELVWPEGWPAHKFAFLFLAARNHTLPDFSADEALGLQALREVMQRLEAVSEEVGYYIFDMGTHPEPWQPAPHVPKCVLACRERVWVQDYNNADRILAMHADGQDSELLLTRACKDCGEIMIVTVGFATSIIKKHRLVGGKYLPPSRCRSCKVAFDQHQRQVEQQQYRQEQQRRQQQHRQQQQQQQQRQQRQSQLRVPVREQHANDQTTLDTMTETKETPQ